jgi:hypothetical protein
MPPLLPLSARPTLTVDNQGRSFVGDPSTAAIGIPGPLGRARLVFALPTNGDGPVNIASPLVLQGPLSYVADPDGNLIGSTSPVWVHRLVRASRTSDTRRLG